MAKKRGKNRTAGYAGDNRCKDGGAVSRNGAREGRMLEGPLAESAASGDQPCDEKAFRILFSDEGEQFRTPAEPECGQWVTVRLRVESNPGARAYVLLGETSRLPMAATRADGPFTWFEARFLCGLEPLSYRFVVEVAGRAIAYQKDGARWADGDVPPELDFRIFPGFATPAWAKGALLYQIFPDRFFNGEPANDVVDRECAYNGEPVRRIAEWNALPTDDDYRCFYGGDLQGVAAKLDYLQSLGVEAVYLNPVFVSPSSHKYDTQDYGHIDPHLAVICDDVDRPLAMGDVDNRNAAQYARRTTSPENLRESDELFAGLCQEIHRRGMRIILDGVFNHCGSFGPWMDREGFYQHAGASEPGAFYDHHSPFRPYFRFTGHSAEGYEAWWHFPTLPKLNYEQSPELCERIIGIARHWASPPYCIDGWRLDVAADLGHSEEFNHRFWRRFRDEVKQVNPNLVIIAEHYGDAAPWLQGDQWDTVMNYDAFMDPLTFFLTGMEKHSDARDDALYLDGAAFCATMRQAMARFGWGSLLCAMNELSNHDHSRFLTRTNGKVGRISTLGSAAAGEGVDMRVMREAVAVQMTWPGAPTIYYGDEAGQVGWTDPDSRRTYPWGAEDRSLIALHRELSGLRAAHPALRTGSFALLGGGTGWFAFGRFLGDDRIAVVCNNAEDVQSAQLYLRKLGMEDGHAVAVLLHTGDGSACGQVVGTVEDGMLRVIAPARSTLVLM